MGRIKDGWLSATCRYFLCELTGQVLDLLNAKLVMWIVILLIEVTAAMLAHFTKIPRNLPIIFIFVF